MTRGLKIVALMLFVIVDIAAATLAIRHVNNRPASDDTSIVVPSESPSEPTPTTELPAGVASGLAVTGNSIARFATGACDAPGMAKLDLSIDGGKNFTEIGLPLEKEADDNGDRDSAVTTILSVTIESPQELTLIGRDAKCDDFRFTTENAGREWKQAEEVKDWYVAGDSVVTPIGPTGAGCEVLSVWPISERNARVGCSDGQIRGTDDAGEEFVGLGALDALTAVTFSTIRDGFGTSDEQDCASRVYSTGSAGGEWEPVGCIDKKSPATALGVSSTIIVALVEGDLVVSTDKGENWVKP